MPVLYSSTTKGFYDSGFHKTIPSDAVELSDDQYRTLVDGQSFLNKIEVENGVVSLVLKLTVSEQKEIAKTRIDVASGEARFRFVSAGNLVEEEYRLAKQQVLQWRKDGSPSESVPDSIRSWAAVSGITDEDAAQSIEQTAIAWESVLMTVREIRLSGKAAIDSAADNSDFNGIAQIYIDQLETVKP